MRGRLPHQAQGWNVPDFNPRPLAGATGADFICFSVNAFQSTPPCGGDTIGFVQGRHFFISIHAPLRGRLRRSAASREVGVFQSTPPCGGDRSINGFTFRLSDFNPRPLAGATYSFVDVTPESPISIHAPLRGRLIASGLFIKGGQFQSTPPCGGDLGTALPTVSIMISIHAPLRGRP